MSQKEMMELELKLDYLLTQHTQLRDENALLRENLSQLHQERGLLIQKNQQAAVKIKQIIEQIRKEPA